MVVGAVDFVVVDDVVVVEDFDVVVVVKDYFDFNLGNVNLI